MRLNVYNPTASSITEFVDGTAITVPAKGVASVTERKTKVLLERQPALQLGMAREYSEADFATVETFNKAQLLDAVRSLMRGLKVDVAAYVKPKPGDEFSGAPKGKKQAEEAMAPSGTA